MTKIAFVLKVLLAVPAAAAVLLALYALILTLSGLAVKSDKEYLRDNGYYRALLNSGTWLAVNGGRVHIHAEGLEKIPSDGRFLLVSNHRSKFDPIVTWRVLSDRNLAYISKEENFRIPFYGRIIRRCCCIPIDREDPRKALVTIGTAADILKEGTVSMGVYPEGTRSTDGTLLPFHNGVFKIAQKAHVPIVVLTVEGTEQIHRNFPLNSTDVYLKVAETISAEEVASLRSKELGERVHADFENNLNRRSGQDEQAICFI